MPNVEPKTAIELRGVSINFDGKPVLRDIDLTIPRGNTLCLTGASGSGKSVLLRLMLGLLRPDRGRIFVEEREIENLDECELLKIRGGSMGMVFQEEALFTGLSVFENTAYRPTENGWNDEDIRRAVDEVLTFVGLADELDSLPEELSGGMRRRLEFARALVGWPRIMLYDEPTAGLDPLNATQILNLIIRARDLHNVTSVMVTKRLDEIAYLAGNRACQDDNGTTVIREEAASGMNVVVLENGAIAFAGTPNEFFASNLRAVTYLTHAENGTHLVDTYFPDPWRKRAPGKAHW